ncbi:MAG: SCO family protein [Bacteroidetes bacterium]|nr:SCO family protein [Bacteroidota bacterium]
MKKKSIKRILTVLGILFLPSLFWLWLSTGKNHFKHLPLIGPYDITEKGDTVYHTIPPFSFINQEGKTISDKDFTGKIYVASFFFATCPKICPKMNDELKRVQEVFKDADDLKILSHTVDPEHDSVAVLADYAAKHGAHNKQWYFVTGNKDSIYSIARDGYLVLAAAGKTSADFFHSQDLILIDKEKHIRGIYDGLEPAEVDTLIDEIKLLMHEYKEKK